jgi:TldD protein
LEKQSFSEKQRFFFDHYGVTENDLERYLAAALSAGGDYADLYFEYLSSTSLSMDESMVKSALGTPTLTIFRPLAFFTPPAPQH